MKTHLRSFFIFISIVALFVIGIGVNAAPAAEPHREATAQTFFLPLILNHGTQSIPGELHVNPQSRQDSLDFYHQIYLASVGAEINWTMGDHSICNAGTTSPAFREAVLLRINYFRAMAGVPANVTLSDEYNQKAQKAALMMSVNRGLDHYPPPTWKCYSVEGAQGAGNSNLALYAYSWNAIDLYIKDPGTGNHFVGHRRWIFYPQTQKMGTGDIPFVNGYPAANALWVFDSNIWGLRPDTREEFVAWPPPGYVPYQVVYPRWSLSYPGADFSSATVSMSSGGPISLTVQPLVNGYGENTLVWEPDENFGLPSGSDTTVTIQVNNVKIFGEPHNFEYNVIVFDPQTQNSAILEEYHTFNQGANPGILNEPSYNNCPEEYKSLPK